MAHKKKKIRHLFVLKVENHLKTNSIYNLESTDFKQKVNQSHILLKIFFLNLYNKSNPTLTNIYIIGYFKENENFRIGLYIFVLFFELICFFELIERYLLLVDFYLLLNVGLLQQVPELISQLRESLSTWRCHIFPFT